MRILRLLFWLTCAAACGGGDDDAPAADARPVDADPLRELEPGDSFLLSAGNPDGQDEDPSILRGADGALHAAWYSNRNGAQPDGREDKEIFATRSGDGDAWDEPFQVTRSDEWSFYPSLAEDADGELHLAWWRVRLLPAGCTPGVDCTGTDNRICYKKTTGGAWILDAEDEITGGPGDWLPSIVHDPDGDRVLLYFAATARDAAGQVDLSETTTAIYVVVGQDGVWTEPARVSGVHVDTSHDTYPHVLRRTDGTFAMAWTRYDAGAPSDVLQVIQEPTTDAMFAVSSDGLSFEDAALRSDGGGASGAIDVFPSLHSDHDGDALRLTWLTTDGAPTGAAVELPEDGAYPGDRVARPEIEGYSGRVVPTATPDVFWAAWVSGSAPTQKISARFYAR